MLDSSRHEEASGQEQRRRESRDLSLHADADDCRGPHSTSGSDELRDARGIG
jgi:hypothetical protein